MCCYVVPFAAPCFVVVWSMLLVSCVTTCRHCFRPAAHLFLEKNIFLLTGRRHDGKSLRLKRESRRRNASAWFGMKTRRNGGRVSVSRYKRCAFIFYCMCCLTFAPCPCSEPMTKVLLGRSRCAATQILRLILSKHFLSRRRSALSRTN